MNNVNIGRSALRRRKYYYFEKRFCVLNYASGKYWAGRARRTNYRLDTIRYRNVIDAGQDRPSALVNVRGKKIEKSRPETDNTFFGSFKSLKIPTPHAYIYRL